MPKSDEQSNTRLNPKIIAEAASWLVELHSAEGDAQLQQQFQAWYQQSEAHQLAWQQAQQLQQSFKNLPRSLKQQVLDDQTPRYLNKFMLVAVLTGSVAIAGYTVQQHYFADYRTATGQPKHIRLEDGTRISLNGKTAIDVDYTAEHRQIRLHYGEVFVHTAAESRVQKRPFSILAKHGEVQALGTQFDVKQQAQSTQVAVLEHAVMISNAAPQPLRLQAGQATVFDSHTIATPQAIKYFDYAWKDGLIVADRMPMQQFAAEIEKYYPIKVELAPELQTLIISGTYVNNDLDALLSALAEAYHLQLGRHYFGKKVLISKQK